MKQLFLQYQDSEGRDCEVEVEGEEVVIGRHSDCDLVIPDSRLSRKHCKIQRFADVFVISDLDSSNGTLRNEEVVDEPVGIERKDVFSFGGLEVAIRFDPDDGVDDDEDEDKDNASATGGSGGGGGSADASASGGSGGGSGLRTALIVVPIVGVLLLLFVGIGAIVLLSGSTSGGSSDETARERRERIYSNDEFDSPVSSPTQTPIEANSSPTPTPVANASPTPTQSTEDLVNTDPTPIVTESTPGSSTPQFDKDSEKNIYSFMRRIATNDNRPILTSDRVKTVVSRAGRFRGSSSLAANIRNATQNKAAIKAIANEKGLKPQFLATAAIARLGTSRGDVAAKAREMADTLDKLTIVLSNELADDSLLVVAAYDEGLAGNTLQMRNKLARLTKQNSNASPREIRTIWYLRSKNEISGGQFDAALNFLAIGTITQNPGKFGVKAPVLRMD